MVSVYLFILHMKLGQFFVQVSKSLIKSVVQPCFLYVEDHLG